MTFLEGRNGLCLLRLVRFMGLLGVEKKELCRINFKLVVSAFFSLTFLFALMVLAILV